MFGSQWSQHPSRKGLLFIFDCPFFEGVDISGQPYEARYRKVLSACAPLGKLFQPVPCYSILNLGGVWLEIERKQSHEGVILRRWDSPLNTTLFKLKREVEDDFVILDMVEGKGKHEGRMGALKLGQYNPSTLVLEYVCDVGGGFDDLTRRSFWDGKQQIVGQVCLVRGKGRFESGAIRHPNFVRLRCDKLPTQCILKRISE
jgi:ATP-dependent DNA ligase